MSPSHTTSLKHAVLVQVLGGSSSVAAWQREHSLQREIAYLQALGEAFASIVLVSPKDPGPQIPHMRNIRVVCGQGPTLVSSVAQVFAEKNLAGCPCVLRAQEFDAAPTLLAIRERLIAANRLVTVAARGTFAWTRQVTSQFGPHSTQAHDAGAAEGLLARLADVVIGSSESMVSDLAWRYQLDPLHTAVVPRFVSPDVIFRGAEDRHRWSVLSVAPLVPGSRLDLLVDAVAALPDTIRDRVELTILGEGPERDRLLAAGGAAAIRLTIQPPDSATFILEALASCALYCQPAASDGPPPALLDAMASGAAVIITDAAQVGRLIEHGFTGLRTPPEAPALARVIEGLLDDAGWRDALGTAAGNSVRDSLELHRLAASEAAILAQAQRHHQAHQASQSPPDASQAA